jgi:hypothetical protein
MGKEKRRKIGDRCAVGSPAEGSCSVEESCSESSDIEYEIVEPSTIDPADIELLLRQCELVASTEEFLETFENTLLARSGETVLLFCTFIPYPKIRGLLSKKAKKSINALLNKPENRADPEDVYLFLTERIGSIPLEIVLEAYKKLSPVKSIVFISRVHRVEGAEKREVAEEFPEYDVNLLEYVPYRGEEMLLWSGHQGNKFAGVGCSSFNLFLLDRQDFACFIKNVEEEVLGG